MLISSKNSSNTSLKQMKPDPAAVKRAHSAAEICLPADDSESALPTGYIRSASVKVLLCADPLMGVVWFL